MKVKRKITQVDYDTFYYTVKIKYDSYKRITQVENETFFELEMKD